MLPVKYFDWPKDTIVSHIVYASLAISSDIEYIFTKLSNSVLTFTFSYSQLISVSLQISTSQHLYFICHILHSA